MSDRILIVDDEPANVDVLMQNLEEAGYRIDTAGNAREAFANIAARRPDLILLDVMMPDQDGFEVCRTLKRDEATDDIPVVFTTALNDVRDKVEAFAAGGTDYVTKPFQIEEVLARIETHLANQRLQRELHSRNERLQQEIDAHQRSRATVQYLREEIEQDHGFSEIVGQSQVLRQLLQQIRLVATADTTVLIHGETGTGKELVARALHASSRRRDQPLIKLNCAALPRDLIESELFGHEKGSFTGASQQRKGRFELAHRGTIFLDEVGELPLEAQAKLLRVLQEQEFERVGGSAMVSVDVRVIAATNRVLHSAVAAGQFREDLFYRLNVFPLNMPALRERRDDIAPLANHFVAKLTRKLGRPLGGLSATALEQLQRYSWPGNVRELENVIERAAILSPGADIELPELLQDSQGSPGAGHRSGIDRTLESVERQHILQVLEDTRWVIEGSGGAATVLGINPSTLRGRLRKLGIRKP